MTCQLGIYRIPGKQTPYLHECVDKVNHNPYSVHRQYNPHHSSPRPLCLLLAGIFWCSSSHPWVGSSLEIKQHTKSFCEIWAIVYDNCKQLDQKKNICVFQVSALKKLGMVGRHNILFYRIILYTNCIFQYSFPHFSANLTMFSS